LREEEKNWHGGTIQPFNREIIAKVNSPDFFVANLESTRSLEYGETQKEHNATDSVKKANWGSGSCYLCADDQYRALQTFRLRNPQRLNILSTISTMWQSLLA